MNIRKIWPLFPVFVLLCAVAQLQPASVPAKPEPVPTPVPLSQDPPPADLVSFVNLPMRWRERNYAGGSCVHASTVMILRWQGHFALADWWRHTYRGGESAHGLINKAEQAGLRYAYTETGSAEFLEWVSRTRRGAVIFYYPVHSICFLGYDKQGNAVLLDNNRPERLIRVPKQRFLWKWKHLYDGFAFTVVYDPPPPRPWL